MNKKKMEGKFAHMSPFHTHTHIHPLESTRNNYNERPNFIQSSAMALSERAGEEREKITNLYVYVSVRACVCVC